jgi:hypothetical protein
MARTSESYLFAMKNLQPQTEHSHPESASRRRLMWRTLPPTAVLLSLTTLSAMRAPQALQAQDIDEYQRGYNWAREVAVPEAQRPRRFIVADYVIGPGPDARAMENSLQMLAMLGINTAEIKGFGNLQTQAWQRARQLGITRTMRAIYAPIGQEDKTMPVLYFSWNSQHLGAQTVSSWGQYQAQQVAALGADPKNTVLFHMADEPGWYFPGVIEKATGTPARLELFRNWLRGKGFTPTTFGRNSWNEVYPLNQSQARDLGSRRLFYWTARYPAETASDAFKVWSDALRRSLNPNLLVTSNWNNQISRFYLPSPGRKVGKNPDVGPNAAMGMPDWMDIGRKRAVSALWSEDWFDDIDAQQWSYYADALRSAAREGDTANYRAEFGGFIIGRRLGDHPNGGRYKALSLIGHGAKAIEWYIFGPESIFKGNSYSGNRAAYGQIASANRLIGRAEDLLYPGRRGNARVAILLPGSAQVWDQSPDLPLYQHEMRGLHFALTHKQFPVDFVDETAIADGDLASRGYNILYVTAPNVSAAAQTAIRNWINNGGTAVFSPGAAAADEYNTPTSTLDEARGVRAQVLPRLTIHSAVNQRGRINFSDAEWGQSTSYARDVHPLALAGATSVANANSAPALAWNRFGRGLAVSYGIWAGTSYYDLVQRGNPNRLPQGWNGAMRDIATAAPRLTRVPRPVEVSVEAVEAARLESSEGIAVTLLNWTDVPQNNVSVVVRNVGAVKSVGSAETGALQFTRDGDNIRVSLPLRDVDVLMIRR